MSLEDPGKILKLLKVDKLVTHLIGYVDTKIELTKLELEEKLRDLISNTLHFFIIILLVSTFLLFLNVGISIIINTFFDNNYAGFLIVSCFYLIIVLFFVLDKKKTISTKITNNIFKEQDQKKDV